MLRGGGLRGSSTALIGAPGSGKTVLGLSALAAGGRAGEPGLYLGFREPPAQILAKGERLGLGLEALCRRGLLELAWRPPFEGNLDELVAWVLEAVARRGCRRLFLDSLDGLRQLALFPERLPSVFAALAAELRRCGVTLLCSEEAPLFRSELELPLQGLSGLAENILLLRYLERGARMHRLLSILKVRDDEYDSTMREFEITAQGLVVAETSASAEALLADTPSRTVAGPGTPQGPGP
jgi:circadian clock protein KaiC